jgi:hypothetical protein
MLQKDPYKKGTRYEAAYLYNIQSLICWGQYNMDIKLFHEFTYISPLLANDRTVKIEGNINLKSKNTHMLTNKILRFLNHNSNLIQFSEYRRAVVDSREYSNQPLGPIKCRKSLCHMRKYQSEGNSLS